MRSSAPARAVVATPWRRCPLPTKLHAIRQSGNAVRPFSYAARFLILGTSSGEPNWHQPRQSSPSNTRAACAVPARTRASFRSRLGGTVPFLSSWNTMHQQPPKIPLLRSTSAANAGQVDSSRALTVYSGTTAERNRFGLLPPPREAIELGGSRLRQCWGMTPERVSVVSRLLGQPDENALGASDVAEPIHVFVLDHFVDELRAVSAEPGERIVEVVHGEHDTQVAQSVHRGVPVIGDHRRREKSREFDPAVAVRRTHHGDLDVVHPLNRHAAILAVRKDHRCPRGARDQVSVPLVAPACSHSTIDIPR